MIDQAARKDGCPYAFNLENGDVPCFRLFRTAAALLSLRTLDLAFTGEIDRAAVSLISSLKMLRVFESEPTLITHFVREFLWAQPCEDLPAVLGAGTLSERSLGDLDEALTLAEPSEADDRG